MPNKKIVCSGKTVRVSGLPSKPQPAAALRAEGWYFAMLIPPSVPAPG